MIKHRIQVRWLRLTGWTPDGKGTPIVVREESIASVQTLIPNPAQYLFGSALITTKEGQQITVLETLDAVVDLLTQ